MSITEQLHQRSVRSRRLRRLASLIAPRLQPGDRVLDVGSGDGSLRRALGSLRRVQTFGVDLFPRESGGRFAVFDGQALPFENGAFDVAMLIDVLHHTTDPLRVLREAKRVARRVVVKDHVAKGIAARATLRFMDRVGNARFGVALPYNYLDEKQWRDLLDGANLNIRDRVDDLHLYPPPFTWIFDRGLHFIATLESR